MNVIVKLKFELAYFKAAVQLLSHYSMGTSPLPLMLQCLDPTCHKKRSAAVDMMTSYHLEKPMNISAYHHISIYVYKVNIRNSSPYCLNFFSIELMFNKVHVGLSLEFGFLTSIV